MDMAIPNNFKSMQYGKKNKLIDIQQKYYLNLCLIYAGLER